MYDLNTNSTYFTFISILPNIMRFAETFIKLTINDDYTYTGLSYWCMRVQYDVVIICINHILMFIKYIRVPKAQLVNQHVISFELVEVYSSLDEFQHNMNQQLKME